MKKNELSAISKMMVERYDGRYQQMGKHIRTLGWGSKEQQYYRFSQTLNFSLADKKSILDIGCGFGDYCSFLTENKIDFKQYTGWDLTPSFVQEANKIYEKDNRVSFEVKDIGLEKADSPVAETGIMLGVLNWNLKNEIKNYTFSENLIKNAFSAVEDCLIVDFLSSSLCSDYPKEDFVFYHQPSRMMDFALSLTNNVVIKHNYAPIPQKEFMLFLYK